MRILKSVLQFISFVLTLPFRVISIPGFEDLSDYADSRVTDVLTSERDIENRINEYLRVTREAAESILAFWAQPTTQHKFYYDEPVLTESQPADQNTVPEPVKGKGRRTWKVPLFGGSTATGTNIVATAYETVVQFARRTQMVQTAYYNFLFNKLMAALFQDASYTYNDEIEGELTITPLADSDGVTYLKADGTVSTNSSVHHLAQADDIATTDPFPGDAALLDEYMDNAGEKVAWVAPSLVEDIKALPDFVPAADPNVITSNDVARPGGSTVGEYIGYLAGSMVFIYRWRRLPAGYYIMGATNQFVPPLLWRMHPQEELQGIRTTVHDVNGKHIQINHFWWAGFAVQDRTAFVVRQIGNASYEIPAGYELPG